VYLTSDLAETSGKAFKRLNQSLKDDIRKWQDLVDYLADMLPKNVAETLKRQLQSSSSPVAVLQSLRGETFTVAISERSTAQALLPSFQSGDEFELSINYPLSFPHLNRAEDVDLAIQILSDWKSQRVQEQDDSVEPDLTQEPVITESTNKATETELSPTENLPASPLDDADSPHLSFAYPNVPLCDDRLRQVNIKYWTRIPISNQDAAHLISLYLQTTHSMLGLFDADLFISDLIDQKFQFCSVLLVNSLLSWSCQSFTAFDILFNGLGEEFFTEAQKLYQTERNTDCLTTVSALYLLSIACTVRGRTSLSSEFGKEGREMATRMNLFNAKDLSLMPTSDPSSRLEQATAHVAWGSFNFEMFDLNQERR
jgi:hypothetical protein